jgi:hypothetical protein
MIILKILQDTFFLLLPLIISGSLHMFIVKKNYLSFLNIPIHLRAFGKNKTWRGLIVMPVLTLLSLPLVILISKYISLNWEILNYFQQQNFFLAGFLLGLGYVLAELPNSFIKRRLNITEGKTSQKFPVLFVILDQGDSALGCLPVYYLFFNIKIEILIFTLIIGIVVHLLANFLLYKIKLRKEPF